MGISHYLHTDSAFTYVLNSNAQQQSLRNKNSNPKMVAKPGTSQHEKGDALDSGPPSAYGWLKKNAPRFGFKNYPPEPWHYSTTGH
ncbi:MAG TPA: M15 family metallopeptidase [Candidatus Eremiobacteraeota bacterium]|nr:MAG: D-alanyl-D-alanine carboxypeptidase [bacterium ADurb.Bin363]HPZ08432.1 M15 family metallopeptidase [Candidatus Eremiobacteraeota bacterium]